MTFTVDPETREMYESDFARLFNGANQNWSPNPEYNKMFLEAQTGYFNDKLAAQGYLFLNDVYQALGFDRIPEGQLVGWYAADGKIFNPRLTANDNGSILIEFNVIRSNVMYFKI